MPLKPPLDIPDLQEIAKRNPGNEDVKALQWEIKRLHMMVNGYDQLARQIESGYPGMRPLILSHRVMLDREPCVMIEKAERDALLGRTGKPPKWHAAFKAKMDFSEGNDDE